MEEWIHDQSKKGETIYVVGVVGGHGGMDS
jgi:hypothetical protein